LRIGIDSVLKGEKNIPYLIGEGAPNAFEKAGGHSPVVKSKQFLGKNGSGGKKREEASRIPLRRKRKGQPASRQT